MSSVSSGFLKPEKIYQWAQAYQKMRQAAERMRDLWNSLKSKWNSKCKNWSIKSWKRTIRKEVDPILSSSASYE